MAQKLTKPKGTRDILPEEHTYFTLIKKVARHRCRQHGMRRITTPVFEEKEVFQRTVGESSDIVSKEMYEFEDQKGRSFALRPEGTAGIMRAFIEHGMLSLPQPVSFYYIEPFYRYDKPQKGRYREFRQFGVEVIGERDPALDVQCIKLFDQILSDLQIREGLTLQLNTIGCPKCRPDYIEALQNYYYGKEHSLCGDCVKRIDKNPLRLLDCKQEDCQILASLAPKITDYLCDECKEFHTLVKEYLALLSIPYEENPRLVRGLDYYTKTVFEYWDEHSGAQNAVGGGGRYDALAELMGSSTEVPAVGFAMGIERMIDRMKAKEIEVPDKDKVQVFVAQLGPEAKKKSIKLLYDLREQGIKAMGALGKASMKAQLRLADKFNADYCLIMGQMEVIENTVILRDMASSKQKIVPFDEIMKELTGVIGEDELDYYNFFKK